MQTHKDIKVGGKMGETGRYQILVSLDPSVLVRIKNGERVPFYEIREEIRKHIRDA